jgi:hypothetical protein
MEVSPCSVFKSAPPDSIDGMRFPGARKAAC